MKSRGHILDCDFGQKQNRRPPHDEDTAYPATSAKTNAACGDEERRRGRDPSSQIIANAAAGRSAQDTAEAIGCARSHVYNTLAAFERDGWPALVDQRCTNGPLKADAEFRRVLRGLVDQSPQDYGFARPTWTRELLSRVAEEQTGVRVSVCVMGRALRAIGARRGRPKPVVECPLSDRQERRRLAAIHKLVAELPGSEVTVFEDEIDIHLNPKIGSDWMNHGTQKFVMTPGKNAKAYVAGSLDARDGTLLWVGGVTKNSGLFVAMLEKLDLHYTSAKRIHVILDNYGIHKARGYGCTPTAAAYQTALPAALLPRREQD